MAEIKCPSCGSPNIEQIEADRYQCPYCGKTFSSNEQHVQNPQSCPIQQQNTNIDDKPGCLMNGLCFLVPIIGFVLFFVKKDSMPKCAKVYLICAIVGFVFGIYFWPSFWPSFWSSFWQGYHGY